MTEEPVSFSTSSDEVLRVELLLAVARIKGSLLSAKDIEELTSLLPEGSDLESIWNQIPILGSRYNLQEGLLIEKGAHSNQASNEILDNSNLTRERAKRNIELAS